MGILARIFGAPAALEETVKGVRDGLDALVYTDEEKATDAAKSRTEARQMVVSWMTATQGQNLARRLLALSITAVWLFLYLLSMAMQAGSVFLTDPEMFGRITAAAAIIGDRATELNGAIMLILAFYFAAPHMGGIVEGAMAKFSGKKNETK